MNATFETFTATHLRIGSGLLSSTIAVVNAYVAFNNGSTAGKLKLYAYLQGLTGVTKIRSEFHGLELKQATAPAPAATTQAAAPMTEYERCMLELNKEKMKRKEAMKEKELKQQEELKKKELAAQEAMKKKELAAQEAMKKNELAAQEAMKKNELAAQEAMKKKELELKVKKIASQEAMKEKELKHQEKLKAMDLADKEKDRAFIREENNKNRQMYCTRRFNKYLDLKVYGTPQTQYITQESLVDVLGFNVYNALGDFAANKIYETVNVFAEEVPIMTNGLVGNVMAVKVDQVKNIVNDVVDTYEGDAKARVSSELNSVVDRTDLIPEIAIRDERRYVDTTYNTKKQTQSPNKFKNMKAKIDYVRPLNELVYVGDSIRIKCYCCREYVDLNKAGCHRAHDIPRSDGGDCSVSNIYLTCATCNQAMGDSMSVMDYKVELYVKGSHLPATPDQ